ncbi:phytanoyl-CoA dioxygenase family protein, partial [Candidatus Poribacteria bacterium]|nr:phytanoyl-CoA dioxygenase family protein [Candidatus Poribacteria bacterium]
MAKELSLVAYNDLESQVEALERDGYVYFPNVLDTNEIAELRATMDQLPAIPASHDRDETLENGDAFLHKLISNAFNRDPLYLQFLDRSPVFEVAEAAHGEDCHCIGMHSWLTGPG